MGGAPAAPLCIHFLVGPLQWPREAARPVTTVHFPNEATLVGGGASLGRVPLTPAPASRAPPLCHAHHAPGAFPVQGQDGAQGDGSEENSLSS